jgi:hypothetical protein
MEASGFGFQDGGDMKTYMDVEDLEVYQKLCRLHIEISELSHEWPLEEKYEIGSQVRRSSNSSPAQLAEKTTIDTCVTRLRE